MDQQDREKRSLFDYGIFAGGLLAGFIVAVVLMVKAFHLNPGQAVIEMTYVDLVTILLAAVAVIVTGLGVIIGILAIWGIAGLRRVTHDAKREAKSVVIVSLREGGELHELVRQTVLNTTYRDTGMDDSSVVENEDPYTEGDGGKNAGN